MQMKENGAPVSMSFKYRPKKHLIEGFAGMQECAMNFITIIHKKNDLRIYFFVHYLKIVRPEKLRRPSESWK